MNQEDKELLVKDLFARLPYRVKCQYTRVVQEGTLVTGKSNWIGELKGIVPLSNGHIGFMVDCDKIDALEGDIKPLLRPMSSMTEEEKKEMHEKLSPIGTAIYKEEGISTPLNHYGDWIPYEYMSRIIDWLNAHHFDYRGLIPMGLAIEVTKDNNPYKD